MDIEDIQKLLTQLAAMMKENKLSELEVEQDGLRIHLKKEDGKIVAAPAAPPAMAAPGPADEAAASVPSTYESSLTTISSPMVGTLYRASSPDADMFVEIGDTISEDTVMCVIEAMKVFNEIRAECEGRVADILIGNGEAVEYGQPLFLIEPIE